MLDSMSYNPGPTRKAACTEVYNSLRVWTGPPRLRDLLKQRSNIYIKDVIRKVVFSYEEGGLGSQAGWLYCAKSEVENKVINIIRTYTKRRNHIITIIKCIGAFSLLYKKVIEKRYAPGGVFETECALQWNPVLMDPNYN